MKATALKLDNLLCFVCDFREYIEDLCQVLNVVVVLGGTEAHEVKEVFLVVQGHVQPELLKDRRESCVRDQIQSPIVQLPLAFEAQPVERLRLNAVALKQLQHASKQILLISRVFVKPAAQAVQNNVLLLCGFLQVTDQRFQLRLVREHSPRGLRLLVSCLALLLVQDLLQIV